MPLSSSLRANLRFLLVEVTNQLRQLAQYFDNESIITAQQIIQRSGYAYSLKQRIQNGCTMQLAQGKSTDTLTLRAVTTIAHDLERLTELCRDCVQQLGYLRRSHRLDLTVFQPLLRQVIKSTGRIEAALVDRNTDLALKLGESESKLGASYQKLLKKYTQQLKQKKHTEDLVTGLFVAHSIEQMGNALLSISESIISSNIGQPMDVQRFYSLRDSLSDWLETDVLANLDIQPLAETRSGSGISSVNVRDSNDDQHVAIFKDGERRKLKEELQGVERWHEIYPGVAPQVFNYKKSGDKAALLIEHLQGMTFEQVVLQSSQAEMDKAMATLAATLTNIWDETHRPQPSPAQFMAQMQKRLSSVYQIHPDFQQGKQHIGQHTKPSMNQLIKQAQQLESAHPPPFSVFIHGDFNIDNVIFEPEQKRINFIDLHRSEYFDYVQDVSVFMVSNYRLQVLETEFRQRVRYQALGLYQVAASYAAQRNDNSFEIRLALGLARSFATSTRFILDKTMARRMFYRARYILEYLLRADLAKPNQFKLPLKELFSD
ncbi:aminoglycoside phosphotransferase family protein [Neiella marina]|uniref:Aminoglycoside phosphotransferase family protein n=1 Tax=Neiella holothuriorum TaxID=2870530 RepID=A0ABS7EDE6_9GAMM|nr:aminoglycoside phosphotransferase family protein [Neiella holothuriorum]MBW8190244.1 aminoglycoside phosphotransferase family protein [Neiella holothuriorum]